MEKRTYACISPGPELYLAGRGYSIKVLEVGEVINFIAEAMELYWNDSGHKSLLSHVTGAKRQVLGIFMKCYHSGSKLRIKARTNVKIVSIVPYIEVIGAGCIVE